MAMISGKMATSKPQRDIAMPHRQMSNFDHKGILQFREFKKQKTFSDSGNSVFAGCSKNAFFHYNPKA
jgi:hypothetical protein